tara:strand:+ start:849 stop:1253 length:405 start_codon:yes stop_codon:yes gene_type:complete
MKDNLKIFIDGACQPNPGTGGVGIFIANKEIEERISLPLEGTVTNNIAEYQALIICLETIIKKELTYTTIEIFSDSQLICMQFNNKWKCKEKNLSLLLIKAQSLKKEIKSAITVNYIPRELNTIADKLAKDAIS